MGSRAVVALLGLLAGLLVLSVVYTRDVRAQEVSPKAMGLNGPERVYALTANNDLIRFDGDQPNRIQDRDDITGTSENLVGIDFRSANGRLYGLGRQGGVYVINEDTGAATRTSTLRGANGDPITLSGTNFGIDFNPTVDRLRVVSDSDQNLRVNVSTGETTIDPNIRYGGMGSDADTTAVAYTNSREAAFGRSTSLFYIETMLDRLATTNDANSGVIISVGRLGVAVDRPAGFDVVTRAQNNAAYAALQPEAASGASFYSVERSSGDARRIGPIGGGSFTIDGIAIPIGQV